MLSIVFVSHIEKLAQGALELARLMAPDLPMACCGGLQDGGAGTDIEKITEAIQSVNHGEGVLVFADMGSSIMSSEMGLAFLEDESLRLVNAPFVEGGVVAAVAAAGGASASEIIRLLREQSYTEKFPEKEDKNV